MVLDKLPDLSFNGPVRVHLRNLLLLLQDQDVWRLSDFLLLWILCSNGIWFGSIVWLVDIQWRLAVVLTYCHQAPSVISAHPSL